MEFRPRLASNRTSKVMPEINMVLASDRSLRAKWKIILAIIVLGSIPD